MSDVPMPAVPADVEHPHHPFLQHQFEDMGQQHEASTLGMWMFLTTEILFFGGFLCAYAVYRLLYYSAFQAGADQQNWRIGAINTTVLIGSSLTMALAVWAAQLGRRKLIIIFLLLTLLLGGLFVGIKGYEYSRHFHEGLFPGKYFTFVDEHHPELTPGIE